MVAVKLGETRFVNLEEVQRCLIGLDTHGDASHVILTIREKEEPLHLYGAEARMFERLAPDIAADYYDINCDI